MFKIKFKSSMKLNDAESLLNEWVKTDSLIHHSKAVAKIMFLGAQKYNLMPEEAEKWQIVGLLHDADYEKWPEEHPYKIAVYLSNLGENDMAILSHSVKTGVMRESLMEKFLFASDELSDFVIACSLVRPDGMATLNFQSVKKKLKDKSFASKVNRDEIYESVKPLGVELKDHVEFVIECLKR